MSINRDIAKAIGASVAGGNIGSDGAISGGGGVDSAGTLSLVGIDGVIREHNSHVTSNITLDSAYNGLAAGPLTIDSGFAITIQDSATLVIV
jgi:hypothetical protein